MNPENRWVKKAEIIPCLAIEDRYAELFPSNTGMPAKPLRLALGSLIIQKQYDYADRKLVEFRKRLTDELLGEINEMIIEFNHPDELMILSKEIAADVVIIDDENAKKHAKYMQNIWACL